MPTTLNVGAVVPLARGATADVYTWDDATVLKLFHADCPQGSVEHEAQVARAVYDAVSASGMLCVPAVGTVMEWDGRHGLFYERITGHTLLASLLQSDLTEAFIQNAAELLANLHVTLHTQVPLTAGIALPAQRDRFTRNLNRPDLLPLPLRNALRQRLQELPDETRCLCHGDLHPGNILLPPSGPPVVIDWCDATLGNSLADVARTLLLLGVGAVADSPIPAEIEAKRAAFREAYVRHYCHRCGVDRDAIDAWLPVVAASRLREGISSEERERLLSLLRNFSTVENDACEKTT